MSNNLCATPLEDAWLENLFCAETLPVNVGVARGIIAIGTSNLLVLDRSSPQQVLWLYDSDGDDLADSSFRVVEQFRLNHGLALDNGYLYASSSPTVYRWPFQVEQDGDFTVGDREAVIVNMNADGQGGAPQGHRTRTLIFDSQGLLYVSIGSNGNVDADSFRSRIRRFSLTESPLPIDFASGEVFADGLRNTVGLAFDKYGILWGVENGADQLNRADLGGDIHNDNPAEELNRFPKELIGKHWGYPFCWSEFELHVGLGRGTRWAWPSFLDDGITDEYCRNETIASELSMQAHHAPLGIVFYNYTSDLPVGCTGTFPKEMNGYAFIANHGSWNRDVPVGYSVVYVAMDDNGRVPQGEVAHDLLRHNGNGAKWPDGFRPVDVDFDDCGRLLVSSDGSGGNGAKVVRISYQGMGVTTGESMIPSLVPSGAPSSGPTIDPSLNPSSAPSGALPTVDTSSSPSSSPSGAPTSGTTVDTSSSPSSSPSGAPTSGTKVDTSHSPSSSPSDAPTTSPTVDTSPGPSASLSPSGEPMSFAPTDASLPSSAPSTTPTFDSSPPSLSPTTSVALESQFPPSLSPTTSFALESQFLAPLGLQLMLLLLVTLLLIRS